MKPFERIHRPDVMNVEEGRTDSKFQDKGGDPFRLCINIASACNVVFRRK